MLTRMSLSVILVFYLTTTIAQETKTMLRTFIVEYSIVGEGANSSNQQVKTTVQAENYAQAQSIVEGMFNGKAHIFTVYEAR